jgi:hypothetical protein
MNAFDTATATAYITDAKDNEVEVTVTLADGTAVTGDPISVNSKGVNLKVDGKVRSFGLSRVTALTSDLDDEADTDEDTDEEIYAMLGEDMTTADLAAALTEALGAEITPKELRVHLRALGLGVGKGRKYSLTATEFRMVRDLVKADA